MKKIILLFGFGFLFVLISGAADKPNVVIFLVDDMGVMDTSVPFLLDDKGAPKRYPLNDWYRTPNMQRLANQGIRFSDFSAQSVCSPTRASIMTGENATRHGTTTWIAPGGNNRGKYGPQKWNWMGLTKNTITLPRVLHAAGYETIHVGKAHFGPLGSEGANPLNIGFDINVGGATWGQPRSYYGQDNYGNHEKYIKNGKKLHHQVPGLEKYYGTDTFLTEALTLEANAKIAEAVKEKKPFFLYMAHYAVHAPFMPDPRFIKNYTGKGKRAQARASMIEGMDKSLGDILDQLNKLGVAENTLIFFLGDNGSDAPIGKKYDHGSSAPLRGKKGTCYQGGTHVPFIAAWAKLDPNNPWQKKLPIQPNSIQSQMGTVMDLYPTILNLIGVDDIKGHIVDGFNLAALLEGKKDPTHSKIFLMHFPHPHNSSYFTMYRSGNWKVVYDYYPGQQGPPHHLLFNIKEDPFENNNLASKNPEKLKTMIQAMKKQLESEHALYPELPDGTILTPHL